MTHDLETRGCALDIRPSFGVAFVTICVRIRVGVESILTQCHDMCHDREYPHILDLNERLADVYDRDEDPTRCSGTAYYRGDCSGGRDSVPRAFGGSFSVGLSALPCIFRSKNTIFYV
jgi:hypothetical protein